MIIELSSAAAGTTQGDLLAVPFFEAATGPEPGPGAAEAGRVLGADLDAWAGWLDSLGVENSGVVDTDNPVPYSVVVFRDPDNIQLELIYMAG